MIYFTSLTEASINSSTIAAPLVVEEVVEISSLEPMKKKKKKKKKKRRRRRRKRMHSQKELVCEAQHLFLVV